jgi:PilZ domain
VIADLRGLQYLVLTDRGVPYLLARVRWPDVSQAVSAGSADWLDDPGLFDLPYSPDSIRVSFPQAASVAAAFGVQLRAEPAQGIPSFMRRMPANWSALTPAERQAFGLESEPRRQAPARRLRRLQSAQAKAMVSTAASRSPQYAPASAGPPIGAGVGEQPGNGQAAHPPTRSRSAAPDPRRHLRLGVSGRALIRSGTATMAVGLVDLSEGGVRCVQPEASPHLRPGVLDGPFLLEAQGTASLICLDVPGEVVWQRSIGASTHFGIVFGALSPAETEGIRSFLAAAGSVRGAR